MAYNVIFYNSFYVLYYYIGIERYHEFVINYNIPTGSHSVLKSICVIIYNNSNNYCSFTAIPYFFSTQKTEVQILGVAGCALGKCICNL